MSKNFLFNGRQRSVMLVLLLLLAVAAFAVPAKPGLTRILTLTDGTTVNAVLVGDEHGHFWRGADGKSYQSVAGTNLYEVVNGQDIIRKAQQRRAQANHRRTRRLAPRRVGEVGSITGEKKGLIILVNFQDVKFQETNTNALFQDIANYKGFTKTVNDDYSFKGSMHDYFYDQSEGRFELTFDVVGPVTVSQNQAHYGENDEQGNDMHPAEMVIEAVNLADSQVNFADYDWNNDKIVEQVYVVYAGMGEADGGAPETIWPHEYDLYSAWYWYHDGEGSQSLDGVKINTYACGGELNGEGLICGIGTMCHEFSHCLGYPDFYDTDYSGGQGMDDWDLMCSGSYTGGGYCPAGYTSYERWVVGWKKPIELVNTQTVSNMAALQTYGSNTYVIYNKKNNNEYYLLENRQKIKWDTYLPGEGLLILHVDYDSDAWTNNKANDEPAHQRMTWIPADNEYQKNENGYLTYAGLATDPFPYGSVNAFGKNTFPAATLYNDKSNGTKYLDCSILNITQNNGIISFDFNGESNIVPTPPLYLANNSDNSSTIATAATNDCGYNVTLANRTLYKDGSWNTLCLPFSLSAEQIAASDLAGADIRALSSASFSEGSLTLNFTPETGEGTVTSITAGTPYIIKWASGTDIVNPVFTNVIISSTAAGKVETTNVDFMGTYSSVPFTANDRTKLYLGYDADDDTYHSKLYYPNEALSVGSCRAYFELKGITAGDLPANNIKMYFGNDATGVFDISTYRNVEMMNGLDGAWYSIDGRKLQGKPTKRGIYINNGRKVVIK